MYQNFIGIDIGKDAFYTAVYGQDEVNDFPNTPRGFLAFIRAYAQWMPQGLMVLETTGGYEMPLIRFLQKRNYAVHRANTRKVKHFIRSYGCLGKSDRIDALELAHYGYERHSHLSLFVEHERTALLQWVGRRQELKQLIAQEKNRLQAPEHPSLKKSYLRIIEVLSEELHQVDACIAQACQEIPHFNEQKEVLKTIPGIGEVTAIGLLAVLPELGKVNRKQIASLGGLAPHPNESGKKIGYRYTRGGRATVKPILFMSAMTVTRTQSQLGEFYKKLTAAGKKKMVALVAVMRKILVIANARMRDFYLKNGLLTT